MQYQGCWRFDEARIYPGHPAVAESLNSLAALYQAERRYADALPIVKRTISQNFANKSIAFSVLYGSGRVNLISPNEELDASYTVLQRSVSSAAGDAISKLAVRFAAGTNELAQLVRKDQDLKAEVDRLDKSIDDAVLKTPIERYPTMEHQTRERIDEINGNRAKLQGIFNQRYPDYVSLSKPQPLTVEQTQALLADDEALVAIDLDQKSYVWVITKDRADWKVLSVSAQDVSEEIKTLRTGA